VAALEDTSTGAAVDDGPEVTVKVYSCVTVTVTGSPQTPVAEPPAAPVSAGEPAKVCVTPVPAPPVPTGAPSATELLAGRAALLLETEAGDAATTEIVMVEVLEDVIVVVGPPFEETAAAALLELTATPALFDVAVPGKGEMTVETAVYVLVS